MSNLRARVIGAGLAGCEAAWQLAVRGIPVTLYEMKPKTFSPAHHSPDFAELVCSNSFRGDRLSNAVGLLKEEMRRFDSLILSAADHQRVPAGGALAVDRVGFSREVTERIRSHPLIEVAEEEVTEIPEAPAVIATGPLTSEAMSRSIQALPGLETLNFYDAAAPVVTKESLDMGKIYRMSRYGRGDDYLNCPMNEAEYNAFIDALISAETAEIHGFEETKVFEGCMPIESMAKRGRMVPAFGPMKPVGLKQEGEKPPFAVVQLRQDDAADTLYNLVGFQTRLKFPEQRRVFGLIPGLEHAEFARYGVMHRNTFLSSPGFLNERFEMIHRPGVYFAGQMTGVEGYVESAASGLVAGICLARTLRGLDPLVFPGWTALGAMGRYISTSNAHFQPMNCAFGLIDALPVGPGQKRIRNKAERYEAIAAQALSYWEEHKEEIREGKE
ncbi:MAG: methylenetetrahydrofolate--tRNA-(uracil(54)-C(5))-methyltransferase (FADH(2)-oxidizing) TrmFO [Clostridiales bacterium]|nr:methylenetetrahydrofolate--tRNA-(uracil(54)-C(5))-methyltransferase (FADH(2)-oxidizing) TrmFO [Clostridiales bacterium]